jgi:DNA-binding winged helix-turn-helix (wHTH) protein
VIARFGAFVFDADQRQLSRDGRAVHLTAKAFELLVLLIAEAPRVVRKGELHDRLWPDTFVSDVTLAGLIKELRRALDDRDRTAPLVRTAHGVGYAFTVPVDRVIVSSQSVTRWIVTGGRRVMLHYGENIIGRDPAAAVFIDAPGVSRRHARIVVSDTETVLEDLGSKNGTKVKRQPVTGRIALHDGDLIEMGPTVVVYHQSVSGVSTETVVRTTRQ